MASDVWISVTSLGGVLLGGGLSFLVQSATQRSAERAAERRQAQELTEARRAERLAHLQRFIAVAADAERCAFTRPTTHWEPDHPWAVDTQEVMNQLWVAERMIQVLFPPPVYAASGAYFDDLNLAVWEGLPPGQDVRDYLDGNRVAFIDASRAAV